MLFNHDEYGFKIKNFKEINGKTVCELFLKLGMVKKSENEFEITGLAPAADSLSILKELKKSVGMQISFLEDMLPEDQEETNINQVFNHEKYGFKIKNINPPTEVHEVKHEAMCSLVLKLNNMEKVGENEYRILGPAPATSCLRLLKELEKSISMMIKFLEKII
jgi:hypothetical protein